MIMHTHNDLFHNISLLSPIQPSGIIWLFSYHQIQKNSNLFVLIIKTLLWHFYPHIQIYLTKMLFLKMLFFYLIQIMISV
jgi:hypothetical protein